jgi:hypothetical protein
MMGFILPALGALLVYVVVRYKVPFRAIAMVFVLVLAPLMMAMIAFWSASPPIWTLLAPRAQAVVLTADVLAAPDGERLAARQGVDVRVALDDDRNRTPLALLALDLPQAFIGPGQDERLAYQNKLRIAYPIGARLTVRVAGDVVYVDRQDWFMTGFFALTMLFALLAAGFLSVLAVAGLQIRAQAAARRPD